MSDQEEIEQLRQHNAQLLQQNATQEDTIKTLWVQRAKDIDRIENLERMHEANQAYIAKLKAGKAKAGVQDIMQEVFGDG